METKRTFSWTRLLVGLALLVPLLTTCLLGKVLPASLTALRSFQRSDIIRQPEFVGLDNYARLFEDKVLPQAIGHTMTFAAVRLFLVAVFPVVLAYLLSRLGRLGRTFYRVCLTLVALLFVPISLLQGWRLMIDPRWGLLKGINPFAAPDTALQSLLFIDGLMVCGIAGTLGTMIYALVFRGANGKLRRALRPLLAVWLVLGLAIAFGSLLVFTPSFVITGGGPMNRTMTWALYAFMTLVRNFRFGYASATYTPLLLLYFPLILVVWGVTEWSGLRLAYVENDKEPSRYGLLIGLLLLPVMLIVALPLLAPHLYSLRMVIAPPLPGPRTAVTPGVRFGGALVRSLVPIAPLLLVALPCAYLAALSISLIRPLGHIGSKVLFFLFLAGSAIPVAPLMPALIQLARDLGLLNTVIALALPYMVSGVALYVLKLFFDSRHKAVDRAAQDGTPMVSALLQHAVMPSLPIVLLVLVVISFAAAAIGNIEWVVAAISSRDRMPTQLLIIQQAAQMSASFVETARYATQWTAVILILWAIPSLPLQIWLVDRLALTSKHKEP
jgi:multiple sugar transport system permease protein